MVEWVRPKPVPSKVHKRLLDGKMGKLTTVTVTPLKPITGGNTGKWSQLVVNEA